MPSGTSRSPFIPANRLPKESNPPPPPRRSAPPVRTSAPPRASAKSSPSSPPTARVALAELGLPAALAAKLKDLGFEELYPPQADAIRPILKGRSVVLACPTASGKSLVAYVALVAGWLRGLKGLYVVPLRALASEKAEELRAFESLGLKVGVTMGEWDLTNEQLQKVDILVATSEKADSLLRRRSDWIRQVGVIVADEVHLLRDADRGPTLEISITRLRRHRQDLQVVALSATVANSAVLAAWLKADHVASEFRPTPLKTGVYYDGEVQFRDGTSRRIPPPGDPTERLVRDILTEKGQALVFVNTRRSSESLAEGLGPLVAATLSETEKADLATLAEDIGKTGEEETEGLRRLRRMVPNGTAYHNASLTNPERALIEKAFRLGRLKCLVATPTLAAGINLPARRVIVRDLTRYDENLGRPSPLPVLEVRQMCGRAGRPRYDPYGEAVLLAKGMDEAEDLVDRYLDAPPEPVESQLASEKTLRNHLLGLVASGDVKSEKDLEEFLGGTFYGFTTEIRDLRSHLVPARLFLESYGLMEGKGKFAATTFGQIASELYLDPVTAVVLRQSLRKGHPQTTAFALLAAVAATPDLAPLYLRRGDEVAMSDLFQVHRKDLLVRPGEPPGDLDDEVFLATLKTAQVLEAWLNDRERIVDITETYGVSAGDLRAKAERAEWLLSSMARLARWENRMLMRPLDELSVRVRYGVPQELLDLVMLRGIGRVRGRRLYDAGITNQEGVARATEATLARVLGSVVLAREVQAQVHRKHPSAPANPASPSVEVATPPPATPTKSHGVGTQTSLADYPDS